MNVVKFSWLIFTIFLVIEVVPAQSQVAGIQTFSLNSKYLKEERLINVSLPKHFKSGSKDTFDVFYVLDGEWNTSLAEILCEFLGFAKFIPSNTIVVSVPNQYKDSVNMRDRDFTPTRTNYSSISGGADHFLLFLKNELVPFVNKKFLTRIDNSTLYGSSLGGLFAIYAYLNEPGLFKSYLTVEPSLWWDEGLLSKIESKKLRGISEMKNTLWIASRNGEALKEMGIAQFDSLLNVSAPKGLRWKVEGYPNETHFSTIWKGIYDGLRFIYQK